MSDQPVYVFLFSLTAPRSQGLFILDVSRSHTKTHDTRINSSGRVNSTSVFIFIKPHGHQGARASLYFDVSRSHTMTHHSRKESYGQVISLSHTLLTDNTQQSQQTDIHALGGIRNHKPRKRKASEQRLKPRGNWDRLWCMVYCETALKYSVY